jgi:hypothetical protein
MEPNVFTGYLMKGTIGIINNFGYEKCPSNSVDQNKSTYGV